jgi:hypothetical protein
MNPIFVVIVLTITLGFSIWAIDINADRINELEYENALLKKEILEAHKETENCIMENSLLNDKVDEVVQKFS